MQGDEQSKVFRAGLYCTLDSEFCTDVFICAAQIYSYISSRFKCAVNCVFSDTHFRDFSYAERRQCIDLLLQVLALENVYLEVLQSEDALPPTMEKMHCLAMLILHDMRKRMMMPGISKHNPHPQIVQIERHFNLKRVAMWSKFSKISRRHQVVDLSDIRNPKFDKYYHENKDWTMAWINTSRTNVNSVLEYLKYLNYQVKKHQAAGDMIFDLPNVVTVLNEDISKLCKKPSIMKGVLIFSDVLGCLGPHSFVNVLLQYWRNVHSDEDLYPQLDQFDIVVAQAGNGFQLAHLSILLQKHGFNGNILAFDVGSEQENIMCYELLEEMGITNVYLYCMKITKLFCFDNRFRNVRAAYVNPPCSHSAVVNIIDFMSAEGADLQFMRDIYKNREKCYETKQQELLEFCLDLPDIEVVLYVTNSVNQSENESLVRAVLKGRKHSNKYSYKSSGGGDITSFSESNDNTVFEIQPVPIDAEGFPQHIGFDMRIDPLEGRNGCYLCPIVRKYGQSCSSSNTNCFDVSSFADLDLSDINEVLSMAKPQTENMDEIAPSINFPVEMCSSASYIQRKARNPALSIVADKRNYENIFPVRVSRPVEHSDQKLQFSIKPSHDRENNKPKSEKYGLRKQNKLQTITSYDDGNDIKPVNFVGKNDIGKAANEKSKDPRSIIISENKAKYDGVPQNNQKKTKNPEKRINVTKKTELHHDLYIKTKNQKEGLVTNVVNLNFPQRSTSNDSTTRKKAK